MSDCGYRVECDLCGCLHLGICNLPIYDDCQHGCVGEPCREAVSGGICGSYRGHPNTSRHLTEGEWYEKVRAFNERNYPGWDTA